MRLKIRQNMTPVKTEHVPILGATNLFLTSKLHKMLNKDTKVRCSFFDCHDLFDC